MIKGFGSPVYQVLEEIQVWIVTETTGEMNLEFKDYFLENSQVFWVTQYLEQ